MGFPTKKELKQYYNFEDKDEQKWREKPIYFSKNFKTIKLKKDTRLKHTLYITQSEYLKSIFNKEHLLSIEYLRTHIDDNIYFGDEHCYGARSRVNRVKKK